MVITDSLGGYFGGIPGDISLGSSSSNLMIQVMPLFSLDTSGFSPQPLAFPVVGATWTLSVGSQCPLGCPVRWNHFKERNNRIFIDINIFRKVLKLKA